MNLHDIITRDPTPAPWAEGEKIPWNEPEFSRRMLREHLSQAHDMASRRSSDHRPACCVDQPGDLAGEAGEHPGPGLRAGILLPAPGGAGAHLSQGSTSRQHLSAMRRKTATPTPAMSQGDVRTVEFGTGYNLAMMLYGEFNVFRPGRTQAHPGKGVRGAGTRGRPAAGGAHLRLRARRWGRRRASWYSARAGSVLR